ncbi:vacuolar sorting protein VPS33/slp1 [Borealophlyctis nickersoniae]|nr:vacuolar sorting protein VPS33/slp1 [Borealophlyctis nickersoniae]
MSIRGALQKRLLDDMVNAVNPPGKWKIMVADPQGMKVLNAVCKMTDLTDAHVTLVEDLTRKRKPYPQQEAIYFIGPDSRSVQLFIEDFTMGRAPYAAAHVFCISELPDHLFDKIKNSAAASYIKSVKELNVDFMAPEQQVFTLQWPNALKAVYNPRDESIRNFELGNMAKKVGSHICIWRMGTDQLNAVAFQIRSVLAVLGEYPHIRYYDPSGGSRPSVSGKLANLVQGELDNLCRMDPKFPPQTRYQRAILLIVDRSTDMLEPLLHHFTYQAMATDLLEIDEEGKYHGGEGDPVQLDDSDLLWAQARHWHIAEVMEFLAQGVKQFTSENKAAQFEMSNFKSGYDVRFRNTSLDKINQLKDAVNAMPQYQEMKAKYALHTAIVHEAFQIYQKRRLEKLGALEQDIATGETAEGRTPRLSTSDVLSLINDPNVEHVDKLRLMMLYIIGLEGISESDRQKLTDQARLNLEESQAVHNLSMLGVRLSASMLRTKDSKKPFSYAARKTGKKMEHKFENTRYTPAIKYIMEDQIKNAADSKTFPWVREPPAAELTGRPATWAVGTDPEVQVPVRTKANWATRNKVQSSGGVSAGGMVGLAARPVDDLRANGARLIVFVLGGATYGEVKACYDVTKETQREIIIGSTEILTPGKFVDQLKDLHRDGTSTTLARPSRPNFAPASPTPSRSNYASPSPTPSRSNYASPSPTPSRMEPSSRMDLPQRPIEEAPLPRRPTGRPRPAGGPMGARPMGGVYDAGAPDSNPPPVPYPRGNSPRSHSPHSRSPYSPSPSHSSGGSSSSRFLSPPDRSDYRSGTSDYRSGSSSYSSAPDMTAMPPRAPYVPTRSVTQMRAGLPRTDSSPALLPSQSAMHGGGSMGGSTGGLERKMTAMRVEQATEGSREMSSNGSGGKEKKGWFGRK